MHNTTEIANTMGIVTENVERANKLLDEAGWKPGADGVREKDGIKLQPKVYYTQAGNTSRVAEAIQGYLRRIGVHWQLQPWDSTIASVKMAEQDYEIWSVTVPYLSAGDLMNIYFDSRNIPTPNPITPIRTPSDCCLCNQSTARPTPLLGPKSQDKICRRLGSISCSP